MPLKSNYTANGLSTWLLFTGVALAVAGCTVNSARRPVGGDPLALALPASVAAPSVEAPREDQDRARATMLATGHAPSPTVADLRPASYSADANEQVGEPIADGPPASNGAAQAEADSLAQDGAVEQLANPLGAVGSGMVVERQQSVDYFVALAVASHPKVQAARNRVAAACHEIEQVRALPDPMLNNVFWPIEDQALQTAGGRMAHQFQLSQQVPWPEKLRAKGAIAAREVQMARAEVARLEREIAESVRLAYYELWYATEAIAIVHDTRALVDDLTRVAEARYKSGGSQQDVLRAQLEADRLDDQLVSLVRQKQQAQADLAALVQQPATLIPEPTAELDLSDVPAQLDQLLGLAEQCSPELRALAAEIRRDRQKQRLACLQQYPDLQLGVNYGIVDDDRNVISPVANGHDNISFGVGVTLPIWHGKIDAGIREAACRTSSTIRRLEAERDGLYGRLRRLTAQADALVQQIDIYENRIIPRTEDTLKLSVADYRGRGTDFFSLIETYRELLMFETQLARIRASLASTLAQIERTVGCGGTG